MLALVDGEIQLMPLYCRDRMCACCQKKRSRKLGAELREFIGARATKVGDVHNMVTLTLVKPHGENPEPALAAIRGYWRRLSNIKTRRGREFHRRFPGGLRSIEVTWSERGDRRRDGSTVPYSGWHAHLHLGVQCSGPDGGYADMKWIVREWCAMTGARAQAQHWAPLDDARIGQLAMYVVKPLGDAHKDRDEERRDRRLARARELARRLHAKRLHEGWGTWKGWRKTLDDHEPSVIAFAVDPETGSSVSLVDLVWLSGDRATAQDATVEWQVPGEHETLCGHTAADALAAVMRWAKAEQDRCSARARRANLRHQLEPELLRPGPG